MDGSGAGSRKCEKRRVGKILDEGSLNGELFASFTQKIS
jgi:hypothetical protein